MQIRENRKRTGSLDPFARILAVWCALRIWHLQAPGQPFQCEQRSRIAAALKSVCAEKIPRAAAAGESQLF